MHTGRGTAAHGEAAGFSDPLQRVTVGDSLYWWQSPDIKVDAPTSASGGYQFAVADVDFVTFETALQHDNPDKGNVNRVYVRVQNRGTAAATNVTVKALFAGASGGLPNLPADFWTQFPNDSALPSPWTAIGPAQMIPMLDPTRPEILEWDWNPPTTADTHSCMLIVMDGASDPIPAASKVFTISDLVRNEKRAALKNLHVVNLVPKLVAFLPFRLNIVAEAPFILHVVNDRVSRYFSTGLVLPKKLSEQVIEKRAYRGFKVERLDKRSIDALREQWIEREYKDRDKVERYLEGLDLKHLLVPVSQRPTIKLEGPFRPMEVNALLLAINTMESRSFSKFSVVQEGHKGRIEGGSTFILRGARKFRIG